MKKGAEWIPFYRTLRSGAKRGLPRAARFIYLELSMESRTYGGSLPLPRGFRSDADAVHDILGGDRREIERALGLLQEPQAGGENPMIVISGDKNSRVLTVTKHREYVSGDFSTPRVQAFRERAKSGSESEQWVTHDVPVSETLGGGGEERIREEKRGEERRGDARARAPSSQVKAPEPLTLVVGELPAAKKPRRRAQAVVAGSGPTVARETPAQVLWRVYKAAWSVRYGGDRYGTTRNDPTVVNRVSAEAAGWAQSRADETGEEFHAVLEELLEHWSRRYLDLEENFHETRKHPLYGLDNDLNQLGTPPRWRIGPRPVSGIVPAAPVSDEGPAQTAADRARLARAAAPRATTGTDDEVES